MSSNKTHFDYDAYIAEIDQRNAVLEAMDIDQLVSHIEDICSKAPFSACLVMGEHFMSVREDVVKILSDNGYKPEIKLDQLWTCPVTRRVDVLNVNKALNDKEKALKKDYYHIDEKNLIDLDECYETDDPNLF